jgi:hypothetical protein
MRSEMVLQPALLAMADAAWCLHEQAGLCGRTRRRRSSGCGRGNSTSIRRGVYAWRQEYAAKSPLEKHRMVAALTLALGAPGVLSQQTAAAELPPRAADADLTLLHVTRPSAGSRTEAASSTTPASCHVATS